MFYILLLINIIASLNLKRFTKELLKTELEYREITSNLEDKKEKLVQNLTKELTKETLANIQGMITKKI